MRDAKVSIMTHAFMYGTATFEGIRAYWNAGRGRLYGAQDPRARRAHPPVVPDPADGERAVGRRAHRAHRRDDPPQRLPRGRLHPAVVLQVDPGDRRPAPRPRQRAVHHRAAVRELHRHRHRRPGHDLVVAAQRGRGAAGPRQDRRRLREHGLPEVRGRAQRLRRGGRPDRRRPRQRGIGGQPVRRPRRRRADPAGQRRHPRGRHPQGDHRAARQRGDPGRGPLDRPVRAVRRPTRSSCAGPASRSHRSSRSTTGRSVPEQIGPIGRIVRDRYFDAVRGRLPEYAHWLTPIE